VYFQWLRDRGENAPTNAFDIQGILDSRQDDRELITTQSGSGIYVSKGPTDSHCGVAQRFVSGCMAESVVDLLEAVEVDKQQAN
jgi:hypothetical protein